MGIGLFLDVDNTLTVGLIQEKFAALLGLSKEHARIEADFQTNRIDSAQFGRQIVSLFSGAGFTQQYADDHFDDIEQQEYAQQLLRLPATIYLVSSGPSYYVKTLAKRAGIPEGNVLCSEYDFGPDGKLLRCRSVSGAQKRLFVERHRRHHPLTIGVGDHPEHDGPFIFECDISILTTAEKPGFLRAESLGSVMLMVTRLAVHIPHRTKPHVFIGSSSERLDLADALHENLDQSCDPTVWRDGVFQASNTNIESLEKALKTYDFAAFIMTPDDVLITRGAGRPAIRDNIVFEMGLFIGALGRSRCFLLHPRGHKPKLPSDLDGMVFLEYPHDREDGNLRAALRPAAATIQSVVHELGLKQP